MKDAVLLLDKERYLGEYQDFRFGTEERKKLKIL